MTAIIIWSIAILLLLIYFLLKHRSDYIVGYYGEKWTKMQLEKLPKDRYYVINDVLTIANGATHQIDHVVVSPYGVFSIETKQYNGYFTGSKYDKKWVRHVGKKEYYYTNPIRQNYGHVKSLSELLDIDEKYVYNIVSIPSNAKLNIEHDGEIVRFGELIDKILSYKDVVINNVDEIISRVNNCNIDDDGLRKEHIRNVRENIKDDDLNKCPKCGGELVERDGKYGSFLGCSNYPRCRYTRDIE